MPSPPAVTLVNPRLGEAVHRLDAGADDAFVQDRLGHANIQNMMNYMRHTTVTQEA